MADSIGYAWSGHEIQSHVFGSEKKREERSAKGASRSSRRDSRRENGGQEAVTSGYGASENVVSSCSGDGSYSKIKN